MDAAIDTHTGAGSAKEKEDIVTDTLVIGAGPGGLAVAACLARANIPYLVLEQADCVASKWRQHYDRLHLHTAKSVSALPYFPFPKYYDRFPSRQQVVRYLEDYAAHFNIQPRLSQTVKKVAQVNGEQSSLWRIETQNASYQARCVVIATGYNRVPHRPEWPGMSAYEGQILHCSAYKNGSPYRGKKNLVVGFGNSAAEIALDLWEHGAHVDMSVRSPVNVLPREVLGIPALSLGIVQQYLPQKLADAMSRNTSRTLVGDLRPYGLQPLERGPMEEILTNGNVPMLDVGTIALIKQGAIRVFPGIEAYTERGVTFTDGRSIEVDNVILATGYRPELQDFIDLDAVNFNARQVSEYSGRATPVQGLYFCGFFISPIGMFRQMAVDAKKIVKDVVRGA